MFNKIVIPNNKFQMASGQGSHWLIDSPTILSSMCSPPLLLKIGTGLPVQSTLTVVYNFYMNLTLAFRFYMAFINFISNY